MPAAIEATREPADPIVKAGADRLASLMRASRGESEGEPKARTIEPTPRLVSSELAEAVRASFIRRLGGRHASVTLDDMRDELTVSTLFSTSGDVLRPLSVVEVYASDMSWRAVLLVLNCGVGWVQAHMIEGQTLPRAIEPEERQLPSGYKIERDQFGGKYHCLYLPTQVQLGGTDGYRTWLEARDAANRHAGMAR